MLSCERLPSCRLWRIASRRLAHRVPVLLLVLLLLHAAPLAAEQLVRPSKARPPRTAWHPRPGLTRTYGHPPANARVPFLTWLELG